jgi:hypothetical protein
MGSPRRKPRPRSPDADSVLDLTDLPEAIVDTATEAAETLEAMLERAELFAGNAAHYVKKYHGIEVPEYVVDKGEIKKTATMINTPVREYLNQRYQNRAKISPKVRLRLKDILLYGLDGVFKGHLEVAGIKKSPTLTISKDGKLLLTVRKGHVATCFYGKGTPKMLAKTIELLQLWIVVCTEILEKDTIKVKAGGEPHTIEIEDLQTMVDSFLGVDCNGFTGHYLKAKFPALKVSPGTHEYVYASKEAFNRKKVTDIKVDDTAVLYKGGQYHHTAMVSQVLWYLADEMQVVLAEARGTDEGGPQVNIWRVKQQSEKGKPKEGKFDIVTRKETFVKFVSPDRFR